MNNSLILLSFFFLTGCSYDTTIESEDYTQGQFRCLFFFLTDCPASKRNFKTILDLNAKYYDQGLRITPILSDPFPDQTSIDSILSHYSFDLPIVYDSSLTIAKQYSATTTPQVMLFNDSGKLVYNGQVDNEYYEFGKHGVRATEDYLLNAIELVLHGMEVEVKQTKPIGCKINFDSPAIGQGLSHPKR